MRLTSQLLAKLYARACVCVLYRVFYICFYVHSITYKDFQCQELSKIALFKVYFQREVYLRLHYSLHREYLFRQIATASKEAENNKLSFVVMTALSLFKPPHLPAPKRDIWHTALGKQ